MCIHYQISFSWSQKYANDVPLSNAVESKSEFEIWSNTVFFCVYFTKFRVKKYPNTCWLEKNVFV